MNSIWKPSIKDDSQPKGWDDIVKSLNETIGMGMSQEELSEQALQVPDLHRQKFIEMIEAEIKPIEDSVMDIHKGIEENRTADQRRHPEMVDADAGSGLCF